MGTPIGLNVKSVNGLLFVDKPDGMNTHAPSPERPGFCEILRGRLGRPLFVCHRLDQATSGAMVFAENEKRAEELRQMFVRREIEKTYWFITDGRSTEAELRRCSRIEKIGSRFVSSAGDVNAETHFQRIKRSPFFELWEARPRTGKPHQIRLHAKELGLPILGDVLHGGTPFPRLCLHSLELRVPGEDPWVCPAPRIFERLGLLKDEELSALLTAMDRRQRLFNFLAHPQEVLRLIDREVAGISLDLLGEVAWLSWYREEPWTEEDLQRFALLGRLLGRKVLVQDRPDRGKTSGAAAEKKHLGEIAENWLANESPLRFEFRRDCGESSGLFLDQRLNRRYLSRTSKDQEILNLFCYTGGFGLAAGKGGARLVTQVDLSPVNIEWSRRNAELNGLNEICEYFAADAIFFLERAIKKDRRWDIIVCDPPIFSRRGKEIFRIEKDWRKLLDLCRAVLRPRGRILFSTHYGKWSWEHLEMELKKRFPEARIHRAGADLDFTSDHSLKAYWLDFASAPAGTSGP